LDNLLHRIERMTQRLDPLFVNVTWGSVGSTAVQSVRCQENRFEQNMTLEAHGTHLGICLFILRWP
jgi:5,10-methylenetetrahydrofolate reductase